jgi:hypothetical protein
MTIQETTRKTGVIHLTQEMAQKFVMLRHMLSLRLGHTASMSDTADILYGGVTEEDLDILIGLYNARHNNQENIQA